MSDLGLSRLVHTRGNENEDTNQDFSVNSLKFVEPRIDNLLHEIENFGAMVREILEKWTLVDLEKLMSSLDEETINYTERKEKYVERRKYLTKKVKIFTRSYLKEVELTTVQDYREHTELMRRSCKDMISCFKEEFDELSSLMRGIEAAYLTVYKSMRDVSDPIFHLRECIRVSQLQNEFLLDLKSWVAGVISNSKRETKADLDDDKDDAINSIMEIEQREIISKIELDYRQREQNFRSRYEEQQSNIQNRYDEILARKDAEIQMLVQSVNEYKLINMERQQQYETINDEITKKNYLEEKLRLQSSEVNKLVSNLEKLKKDYEKSLDTIKELELRQVAQQHQAHQETQRLQLRILELNELMRASERELRSRAPVEYSDFLAELGASVEDVARHALTRPEREGFRGDVESPSPGQAGPEEKGAAAMSLTWQDVQGYLVHMHRKLSSENVQYRLHLVELQELHRKVSSSRDSLQNELIDRQQCIQSLERDLMEAHEAIRTHGTKNSRGNLQPRWSGNGSTAKKGGVLGSSHGSRASRSGSMGGQLVSRSGGGEGQVPDRGRGPIGESREEVGRKGGWEEACEIEGLGLDEGEESEGRESVVVDLEQGRRGEGGGVEIMSGRDRVLQAVQNQRDRYMRTVHEREEEIAALKAASASLQEELARLRGDNVELYSRVRLLRIQQRGGAPIGGAGGRAGGTLHGKKGLYTSESRGEGVRTEDGGTSKGGVVDEDLDRRYQQMYEAGLDVLQLRDLDRRAVLANMNPLERHGSALLKSFLMEQWSRQALLLYLVFLHLCAMAYFAQVLDPVVVDVEGGSGGGSVKRAWSNAFFETGGFAEHPDVFN